MHRTGIGPEAFAYFSSDGNYTGSTPSAAQRAFYNQHGFFITTSYYYMRPEVLESNFYAWRYTGNTTYYDRAVAAYQSLETHLKTSSVAYAPINNVNSAGGGGFIDDMESFWFAEVLKYLYLTFDDPTHISLDECRFFYFFSAVVEGVIADAPMSDVFNTEAHPYIAPAAKSSYGSGQLYPESSVPFKTNPGILPLVSPAAKIPVTGTGA